MIKDENEYYVLLRFITEIHKLNSNKVWCIKGLCHLYNHIETYEKINNLTNTDLISNQDIEKILIEKGY